MILFFYVNLVTKMSYGSKYSFQVHPLFLLQVFCRIIIVVFEAIKAPFGKRDRYEWVKWSLNRAIKYILREMNKYVPLAELLSTINSYVMWKQHKQCVISKKTSLEFLCIFHKNFPFLFNFYHGKWSYLMFRFYLIERIYFLFMRDPSRSISFYRVWNVLLKRV